MYSLNFAIIGYGKMGAIRYETLKKLDGCSVISVYEPDERRSTPEGVQRVRSVEDILSNEDVQAVIICTPNHLVQELVVKCLSAKKHVFSEKPPGRNLPELQAMIQAEKVNTPCRLMFGFNHRHHESILKAQDLINSNEMGKILWLRGRYGKGADDNLIKSWRCQKELAGGGIFLDQGIHMLDLFLMFCGDFQDVNAVVSNLNWKTDVEDNVFAIFRNDNNQVASLHSTMSQWKHMFSLEISCERGYILLNGLKTSTLSYGAETITFAKATDTKDGKQWEQEVTIVFPEDYSWEKELTIFVESLRNDLPFATGSTQDAIKLMKLVDKVYESKDLVEA